MGMRIVLQAQNADGKWLDESVVMLTPRGKSRPFSSGAVGYNASAKATIGSVDDPKTSAIHQVSVNLVEVGSKPTA